MKTIAIKFKFLSSTNKVEVMKLIGAMNIETDNDEFFYFNDVLYAVMRRKHAKNLGKRGVYVKKILQMEDYQAKLKLRSIRDKHILDQECNLNNQNFFIRALMVKSIFRNWKNYAAKEKGSIRSITPQFSDIEYPGNNSEEFRNELSDKD